MAIEITGDIGCRQICDMSRAVVDGFGCRQGCDINYGTATKIGIRQFATLSHQWAARFTNYQSCDIEGNNGEARIVIVEYVL